MLVVANLRVRRGRAGITGGAAGTPHVALQEMLYNVWMILQERELQEGASVRCERPGAHVKVRLTDLLLLRPLHRNSPPLVGTCLELDKGLRHSREVGPSSLVAT